MSVLNNPIVIFHLDPIQIGRLFVCILKVNLFLRFYIKIEVLIGFPLIYILSIPETDVAVSSGSYYLFIYVLHKLYGTVMTGFLGRNRDNRLYHVSLPQ
jgi:hypothetical protein